MRGAFIATGALLLEKFHWVIYVFGAFLVFTGSKMLIKEETTLRPEDNPVIKLLARLMPASSRYEGTRSFVKQNRRWTATTVIVVRWAVESTNLILNVA